MDHITMQDSLEAIGQKLKDTYGKDSVRMQQALPKELERAELQKMMVVPAFNPRYNEDKCATQMQCYIHIAGMHADFDLED